MNGLSEDTKKGLEDFVAGEVKRQVQEMTSRHEQDFDEKLKDLEKSLTRRTVVGTVSVVAAVALAATSAMLGSVISLQKDVLSSQSVIRDSTKELKEADDKVQEATNKVKSELNDAQAADSQLKIKVRELDSAKADYDTFMKQSKESQQGIEKSSEDAVTKVNETVRTADQILAANRANYQALIKELQDSRERVASKPKPQ